MRKVLRSLSFLLALFILTSGCGLVFGGSKYTGVITAKNKPNAEIFVNGKREGLGQVSGEYYRNRPLEIEIREQGCEPVKQTFYSSFRTGNFILSVFSWGLFSFLDVGTGASFKPDHKGNREVIKYSTKRFAFNVEGDCYPQNLTTKADSTSSFNYVTE